eukprot:TRINITY_DN13667_c0_g1_i2.p1 TRINITY_DN13667_c0_g1~~TRINITY_DN13667_c0_g1_i2.p1  ORF type:complete len:757 (+),score=127.00 TRINITY_DN13667_c0_g1_i2:39-2309(+)
MTPRTRRPVKVLGLLAAVSVVMIFSFVVMWSSLPSPKADAGHAGHLETEELGAEPETATPKVEKWRKWKTREAVKKEKKHLKHWIENDIHPIKVTVVIPVENNDRWRGTLESVRAQEGAVYDVKLVVGSDVPEPSLKAADTIEVVKVDERRISDSTAFIKEIFEKKKTRFKEFLFIAWDGIIVQEGLLENLAAINEDIVGCGVAHGGDGEDRDILTSHGIAIVEGNREPVFVKTLAGYHEKDTRAGRMSHTATVDSLCVMTKTKFLEENILSLKPAPPAEFYHEASLSMKRKVPIASIRSGYVTHSYRSGGPLASASVSLSSFSKPFLAKWRNPLYDTHLTFSLNIVWDTFCVKCFGFTNEVMHFIQPLEGLIGVRSEQGENCFCPGTPESFANSLTRLHQDKKWIKDFKNKTAWEASERIAVWVSHKDPGSITQPRKLGRRPDWVVGRSMYEFTKIDPNWIPNANSNDLLDEIWVPSSFVWAVFGMNGVKKEKLTVVPEPIDVHFYDPKTVPKAPDLLPNYREKNYKFLSVFKLEPRKGWDILLEAYLSAFSPTDPVSLYLVCYIWGVADSRNPKTVMAAVQKKAVELGYPLEKQPHIEVITQEVSEKQMASIYRTADAFVLPTKGEGWGLPIIQAMSMGMPAVATNWSGNTDFMNDGNSLPIKVERLEELPADSMYGSAKGKVWAVPSVSHLKEHMLLLFKDPELGCKIGRAARKHIVENYSDEVIARVVEERLGVIKKTVIDRRNSNSRKREK